MSQSQLGVGIIGSPDFARRLNSVLIASPLSLRTFTCPMSEAWGQTLSNRPQVVIIEIGLNHSERQQLVLRRLLSNLKERFNQELSICLALTASETLYFGGDILFSENAEELTPSELVDNLIVQGPGTISNIPSLGEQALNVLEFILEDAERKFRMNTKLPALNSSDWVQSLADPKSRELWMRWLPRYATYTNENPIIIGETGTGKTKLAQALHTLSGREGKFISITPRDFSSSELVQAELFGAVAGAYTGAVDKWGLVKSAEKGTLFIDELQSIDKDLQGKLITFIENKVYRRVGSAETIAADVRFIFASNRTLADMMKNDILRHDFAYRLERVQLELTPLNLRRLDISTALAFSLAKVRRQRPQALPVYGLTRDAYRLLFAANWPGNLRQLENSVAQLSELCDIYKSNLIKGSYVQTSLASRMLAALPTSNELIGNVLDSVRQVYTESESEKVSAREVLRLVLDKLISHTSDIKGGDLKEVATELDLNPDFLELMVKSKGINKEFEGIV